MTIFDDYSTDIVVKKLAPATNSQCNEVLNNVMGSKKIPKSGFTVEVPIFGLPVALVRQMKGETTSAKP